MRTGRRARHALLTLVARRTDGPTARIGFAVSRRVGGSVVRNRLKRQLRMVMRAHTWQPGFDIVVIPQGSCASARFDEIQQAIKRTATSMHLLIDEGA